MERQKREEKKPAFAASALRLLPVPLSVES
jgi:hypothetical protein